MKWCQRIVAILLLLSFCYPAAMRGQCGADIDLNTWSQEGNPGSGNWVVDPTGSFLTQTINGGPTFFVSPEDYINVRINGSIRVDDTDDDDFIGFVFGWKSPLGAPGPNYDFDTWLYDWKQGSQTASGFFANEGHSLGQVIGNFNFLLAAFYYDTWWSHNPSATYISQGTLYGGTEGWADLTTYDFTLTYLSTRVIIEIDGDTIFDVPACNDPGRFGFYNLSQNPVIYSNFSYELLPQFSVLGDVICEGDSADFQYVVDTCGSFDTANSFINTWTWDFGDGNVNTTDFNPSHLYDTLGTLDVKLIVTDNNGCSDSVTNTVSILPRPSIDTLDPTDISCNGFDNGSILSTVSGGSGNYAYSWLPGLETTPDLIDQAPGSYTFILSDTTFIPGGFGICRDTQATVLTEPPLLVVTLDDSSDITCFGDNDGSATLSFTGGSGSPTISWNTTPVQNTPGISGLSPGMYTGVVTDSLGCQDSVSVTLDEPDAMVVNIGNSRDISCAEAEDGFAVVAFTGGRPGFDISWNTVPSSSMDSIFDLGAGTYAVTVTDTNGCSDSDSVTLIQPTPLSMSLAITEDLCFMDSTASLTAMGSGSNGNYSYFWSPGGETTPAITDLGPDTYTLILVDTFYHATGFALCAIDTTVLITTPPLLDLTSSHVDVSCAGAADGSVSTSLTGGTPGFTYAWNTVPIQTTANLTGINGGTYAATVTDMNGCQDSISEVVFEAPPIVITTSTDLVTCPGATDGVAIASASGGEGGFSYVWLSSPNQLNDTAIGLPPGVVTVQVTDMAGCLESSNVTIGGVAPLNVSLATTDVTCFGIDNGTGTTTVTGGTLPYSYEWTPTGLSTPTVSTLPPDTHTLVVQDSNGCVDTTNFVITEPTPIVVDSTVTPNTCNTPALNGTASVTASGGVPGYTYAWNTTPPQTTPFLTDLAPGSYTCTITDANGCPVLASVTVDDLPSPVVSASGTPSFCLGSGGDTVFASGSNGTQPYFYTWWCDQPACGIDSVNASVTMVNPSLSGTYYVQIIDANGCPSNLDSLFVEVLENPVVNAGTDLSICADSAPCVILNPTVSGTSGPFSYQWSPLHGIIPGQDTVTNPCVRPDTTTIYTLIVTAENGCNSFSGTLDSASTVKVVVQNIPLAIAGADTHICFQDSIMLNGIGYGAGPDYSYEWSPTTGLSDPDIANPIAFPDLTTEYVLTVWSNGCPSEGDNMLVNVHTLPTNSILPTSDICVGDTGIIFGLADGDTNNASYTLHWTPKDGIVGPDTGYSILVSPDSTTEYFMTAISNWGCISEEKSVTFTVKPTPIAEAGPDQFLCLDDSLVQLDGGYFYLSSDTVFDPTGITSSWSPGALLSDSTIFDPMATPGQSTVFHLTVQYNTCTTTDSVSVSAFPSLNVGTMADTNIICSGDSLQLNALGGVGSPEYHWSPSYGLSDTASGMPLAYPDTTTTYSLIISEGPCSDSSAITITVLPTPAPDYLSSFTQGCVDLEVDFLNISDDAGIAWIWDFGDGTANSNETHPTHTYTQPGTYPVTLTGIGLGGCKDSLSTLFIEVHDSALANFTTTPAYPATITFPNTTLNFTDLSQNASTYLWDFGDGTTSTDIHPQHTYSDTGQFFVSLTVTSEQGCINTATLGPWIVQIPGLFIPNVFTPNGDGISDKFGIEYDGSQPFTLSIFDRWGVQVFTTRDKNQQWNGTNNGGVTMREGVYFYAIRIGEKEYAGEVTLMR